MPTADELIGCVLVIATIAGIAVAWLVFITIMAGA